MTRRSVVGRGLAVMAAALLVGACGSSGGKVDSNAKSAGSDTGSASVVAVNAASNKIGRAHV